MDNEDVDEEEEEDDDDETRFVTKRQNTFMCFATKKLKFLDITSYLAPGFSYDKYLKAYGCELQKGHFPYEYMDGIGKLEDRALPPQEAFYSRLKNEGISDDDYARCQAVWCDNRMKSMRDFLVWYNNCTNIWIKSMDQKLFTDTVYIDLAKAFDTVSHTKLLHKLPCYGISGNILNWVSSFLNNRKQRVKIGNSFSVYKNVTSGVPQGSCIGPLLFILYVNDLTDYNFDRNTLVSLYADDTKISTIFSDVSERHNMQEHLNEFMRWAAKWQLQIAEHKCCVLSHGNVTQPIYYMHTVQLPNVNECLDLGVFVDSHCSFKHHISHICCKAYTSINIIFRCFDTAHVPALIIASFVRPILEYCSTVWNPYIPNRHYLGLTDQIERVQRYFTRRVYYRCKLDCSHDYLQRLKFLNLESLELRRIYNDLIMVYKIVHWLININANELIHIKTSTSTISTRGHRFKLQTSQFKLDVAKNQFCNRVVCNWNTLPDSIVATDTIAHFKKALRTVHFEAALTFNRHC